MPDEMDLKGPKVSVGMPVYNGARYIREALDSLLAQTLRDFELVISDNASTDETQAICGEYVRKDPRIKYVRQAQNFGGGANFNYLLAHATGDYFTWLACDDFLKPRFLEMTIGYLDQCDDVVVCACDFAVVDEHGALIRLEHLAAIYPSADWRNSQEQFFLFPSGNLYLAIYGVYRRRNTAPYRIKVKATWLGLASGSEIPFLSRMAALGKIVAIPEVLRVYRTHPDSVYNTELNRTGLAVRRLQTVLLRVDQFYVAFIHPIPFAAKVKLFVTMITFTINRFIRALRRSVRRIGAVMAGRDGWGRE